jgi:hypothetical protein
MYKAERERDNWKGMDIVVYIMYKSLRMDGTAFLCLTDVPRGIEM